VEAFRTGSGRQSVLSIRIVGRPLGWCWKFSVQALAGAQTGSAVCGILWTLGMHIDERIRVRQRFWTLVFGLGGFTSGLGSFLGGKEKQRGLCS